MIGDVARSPSGHRRYSQRDVEWIGLITRLRATGMPIREIHAYATLVRDGPGNEHARLALFERHRQRVLAQLAEITEYLGAIDRKIGIYVDTIEAARNAQS